MSKKSWLGGSSDDTDTQKDDAASRDTAAEKKNPSTAGTQDPGLQSANSAGVDTDPKPINILRDDRNAESDDGSVNPHNEAAAQKPSALPLDDRNPEVAKERAERAERIRNPKTDADRAEALKEWGREARLRGGGLMSADWERFQELTGERTASPSAEDIARQQDKEREQTESAAAKQRAATIPKTE